MDADDARGAAQPVAAVPPWRTPLQAIGLILRGVTFPTAIRVALVVGTLLSVINQGGVVMSGDAGAVTGVRVVCNYLIPYTVASIGYLAPFRRRRP